MLPRRPFTTMRIVLEENGRAALFLVTGFESQSQTDLQLFVTPWTVAPQAPLSMGFPRQEYWNGLPFPSAGDLPKPGTETRSSALQVDYFTTEPPQKER